MMKGIAGELIERKVGHSVHMGVASFEANICS